MPDKEYIHGLEKGWKEALALLGQDAVDSIYRRQDDQIQSTVGFLDSLTAAIRAAKNKILNGDFSMVAQMNSVEYPLFHRYVDDFQEEAGKATAFWAALNPAEAASLPHAQQMFPNLGQFVGKTASKEPVMLEQLKKIAAEHPETRAALVPLIKGAAGLSKSQATKTLPGGNKVRVYDIGPDKEMDRYTVIMDGKDWDASANPGHKMSLGLSEGGRGISQWGEAKEGPHLGKLIKFDDLDKSTQKHIIHRVEEEGDK